MDTKSAVFLTSTARLRKVKCVGCVYVLDALLAASDLVYVQLLELLVMPDITVHCLKTSYFCTGSREIKTIRPFW